MGGADRVCSCVDGCRGLGRRTDHRFFTPTGPRLSHPDEPDTAHEHPMLHSTEYWVDRCVGGWGILGR